MATRIPILGLAHVGIRVHDLARSLRFYELFGFEKTLGPVGPEPVVILSHPSGIELNLVLNAPEANAQTKAVALEFAWGAIDEAALERLVVQHAAKRRSREAAEGLASFREKRPARW